MVAREPAFSGLDRPVHKSPQSRYMELYNSAFVVSSVDTARFDQISGKNLSGYFVDNKLRRIKVTGN
ncbi:MAG: hypothetical protein MZV63_45215, partial [Marinilabiliales bacterium]|nr:hypothetical protein [Marinilabiliales bacterium]